MFGMWVPALCRAALSTCLGLAAPTVSLTFDDGPSVYTRQVVQTLTAHDATATFFVTGTEVAKHPEMVGELLAAGMSVQPHGWSHQDLTSLGSEGLRFELGEAVDQLVGLGANPSCVRPPYGATNLAVTDAAASQGLDVRLWTVDPQDWDSPGVDVIVERALDGLDDGDVILLHDGGGDRSQTVQALPVILAELDARGYHTVPAC